MQAVFTHRERRLTHRRGYPGPTTDSFCKGQVGEAPAPAPEKRAHRTGNPNRAPDLGERWNRCQFKQLRRNDLGLGWAADHQRFAQRGDGELGTSVCRQTYSLTECADRS